MDHHVPAGLRPSGLQKRDVPCADIGLHRKIELAEAAVRSPLSQEVWELLHVVRLASEAGHVSYLRGNCFANSLPSEVAQTT